jgi:hypothetical protein
MGRNEHYFISDKKLENTALKWYGHIERMKEERVPEKNVFHWTTQGRS